MEDVFNGQISVTEYKDAGITGNFEVVVNGDLVWSKARGHGFPMSTEQVNVIIDAIRARQHRPLTTEAYAARADVHIQF